MKKKLNNGAKGGNQENKKHVRWIQEFTKEKSKRAFLRFATSATHILCKFNTNLCPLTNELITPVSCYLHIVL